MALPEAPERTRKYFSVAEANKTLMSAGLRAVESVLAGVGGRDGSSSVGYDARGRSDLAAGAGAMVVDRTL